MRSQSTGGSFFALSNTSSLHRHLAKVMKECGEAQFAQLLGCEAKVPERAVARALHGFGETGGKSGDAQRVAGHRRVAQIDRADGRRDETLERALDLGVELDVLDRHGALTRQHTSKPSLAVRIRYDVPIGGLLARDSGVRICLAIDEDEHP